MTARFYEQKIRQFWEAYLRYMTARRALYGPDEQPRNAPEEHERQMDLIMGEYDAELDRLLREAMRDARRISKEYAADKSREHAWVQSWVALRFADIISDARQLLRSKKDFKPWPEEEAGDT